MALAHQQHLTIVRKAHALVVRLYVAALRRKVGHYATLAESEARRAGLAAAAAVHAREYAEDAKQDAHHASRAHAAVANSAALEAAEIGGKL